MAAEELAKGDNSPELQVHRRDYTLFIKLLKWGAVLSFVTAMIVLVIISN